MIPKGKSKHRNGLEERRPVQNSAESSDVRIAPNADTFTVICEISLPTLLNFAAIVLPPACHSSRDNPEPDVIGA